MNNDGRVDIVVPTGWYEQPAEGDQRAALDVPRGRVRQRGRRIGVYDVNGDKLTDVVTSLSAHDWGLAWFEQKRTPEGTTSFVEHTNRRRLLHEEHRRHRVLRGPCARGSPI